MALGAMKQQLLMVVALSEAWRSPRIRIVCPARRAVAADCDVLPGSAVTLSLCRYFLPAIGASDLRQWVAPEAKPHGERARDVGGQGADPSEMLDQVPWTVVIALVVGHQARGLDDRNHLPWRMCTTTFPDIRAELPGMGSLMRMRRHIPVFWMPAIHAGMTGQVASRFPLAQARSHKPNKTIDRADEGGETGDIPIAYRISVLEQRAGLNWIAHPLAPSGREGESVIGQPILLPLPYGRGLRGGRSKIVASLAIPKP